MNKERTAQSARDGMFCGASGTANSALNSTDSTTNNASATIEGTCNTLSDGLGDIKLALGTWMRG